MANKPLQSVQFPGLPDTYTINGAPAGGTAGQVLRKQSGTDYDYAWATILLTCTQAQYDAMASHDSGVLYVIVG